MQRNTHFDLETGDPDDVMALALLTTHPKVNLTGVTVFPGGLDQVALVKGVLNLLGRGDVLVGADPQDDGKARVGAFYHHWLGSRVDFTPRVPDGSVIEVVAASLKAKANLLTGGPLSNIWRAHEGLKSEFFFHWTCQGGFAGDNVVPNHLRLPKFDGMITCPTFNLNGNPKAALGLLGSPRIRIKHLVSKNVCHGFWFDPARVARLPQNVHAGLDLLIDGMEHYFKKHREGKALHDILAVAMHIEPTLGNWVHGEPYREKGNWGFRPNASSDTAILIGSNDNRVDALLAGWQDV